MLPLLDFLIATTLAGSQMIFGPVWGPILGYGVVAVLGGLAVCALVATVLLLIVSMNLPVCKGGGPKDASVSEMVSRVKALLQKKAKKPQAAGEAFRAAMPSLTDKLFLLQSSYLDAQWQNDQVSKPNADRAHAQEEIARIQFHFIKCEHKFLEAQYLIWELLCTTPLPVQAYFDLKQKAQRGEYGYLRDRNYDAQAVTENAAKLAQYKQAWEACDAAYAEKYKKAQAALEKAQKKTDSLSVPKTLKEIRAEYNFQALADPSASKPTAESENVAVKLKSKRKKKGNKKRSKVT